MKRFIPFVALLAVVALAGCSGDSPSAPPAPTVVPDTWGITSLTPSNAAPYVNTVILVDAVVTKNGSPAPDGTSVTFEATGGAFSSGGTEASVLTTDGTASVPFLADTEGTYVIRAQVGGVSREISVPFQDRAVTDALQLYDVTPRRGSYAGGEQVIITGKGILAPVEVYFDLNGTPYQAIVAGVNESVPASADGQITVVTPAFTGANNSIQQSSDVRVVANAGTGSSESATLADAFVLLPGGGPQIFGLSPNSGRSSGGEIVSILGQNFGSVVSDLSVSFTDDDGVVRLANVLSVAPDGTQIQVETPRFSTLPLTEDRPQDVTVSTIDGGISLEDAFIVLADNPQPEIASISPTAGPLDGGTLVTIFGSGFQAPMQVFFGELAATDVNVFDDTSPANQDRITCVSPDYSQQGDVPPVAVEVRVVNINSGNQDGFSSFTYGDALYISGNTPVEGGPGSLLIIYGSGFEDPLQVDLLCADGCGVEFRLEVNSVSGTEIVARIPTNTPVVCDDLNVDIQVTLLESNLSTIGGEFRYLGSTPRVYSVSPVILVEQNSSGVLDPNQLSIDGEFFSETPLVEIGLFSVLSSNIEVSPDGRTIDVFNLPNRESILIQFDEVACLDINGNTGVRNTTTPVDIVVTNLPGECSETVFGAIAIEPFDTTECRIAPNISVTFTGTFPTISVGSCSPSQPLIITNTAPGSSLTGDVTMTGPFYFQQTPGGGGPQAVNFPDIPGNSALSLDVYFCPDQATGAVQSGTMTILSNDPDSGVINQTMTGTEGTPP